MQHILSQIRRFAARALSVAASLWERFRKLPRWGQALVVALLIIVLFGISSLFSSAPQTAVNTKRAVTLRSVAELSGNVSGASVVGVVRSRSEAELRAEASGIVRRVATALGAQVPAGFVLAELENDSERAQVTQAEGAYDAAVAARASVSPIDVETAAENSYRSAFTALDTALETQVDTLFGGMTPYGPSLLIDSLGTDPTALSRERKRIDGLMDTERARLLVSGDSAAERLSRVETLALQIAALVEDLSQAANATNSRATETQVAAITSARASVNGTLSAITGAQATLRSGATGSTASVDASVKAALGTLRAAEASLEKTRIRAPIGGTVNYFPIRVGDYVGALDHVATVAQNGALEVIVFASEDALAGVSTGEAVMLEGTHIGTITSIAPALDPITKQIEVRVAVGIESGLVNGQSVRLTLPGIQVAEETTEAPSVVLLPLAAVKLSAGSRVVFTLGEDGKLAAIAVDIGEVIGERIEVVSPLPSDLRIVIDARGLSDGQHVTLAQ